MSTQNQLYSFRDAFADWRNQNTEQYEKYQKTFSLTDEENIDGHPWYRKRVEPLPLFNYRLPEGVGAAEFDWEFLLKLLESSESYQLYVSFEDLKLVCRNNPLPELKIKMYGEEKIFFLMDSHDIKGLFYDLIDENIKRIQRTDKSAEELDEYNMISKFLLSKWMYLTEKIKAKIKVAELISGNEEVIKYLMEHER